MQLTKEILRYTLLGLALLAATIVPGGFVLTAALLGYTTYSRMVRE